MKEARSKVLKTLEWTARTWQRPRCLSWVAWVAVLISASACNGQEITPVDTYSGCEKYWAHRGLSSFVLGVEENSPASIERAVTAAVAGLELDVHWDSDTKQFWLGHDTRDVQRLETSLSSVLPLLEDQWLWLDIKSPVSKVLARESADHLLQLFPKPESSKILLESQNPFVLREYARLGFHTSLWLTRDPQLGPFRAKFQNLVDSVKITIAKPAMLSANHQNLAQIHGAHPGFKLNTFTVNDRAYADTLRALPYVAVILTDQDWFHDEASLCY